VRSRTRVEGIRVGGQSKFRATRAPEHLAVHHFKVLVKLRLPTGQATSITAGQYLVAPRRNVDPDPVPRPQLAFSLSTLNAGKDGTCLRERNHSDELVLQSNKLR
jgi:hypothetical protein